MGKLTLKNISIPHGNQTVIDSVSLTLNNGELGTLVGPSGVGKTTLLKTIAGLHPADKGTILIDDIEIGQLPADKRDTVLIFQKPLLFPFLNVQDNIGFGLKMINVPRKERYKRVGEVLELTSLSGLARRKIHQLSGGQQQRVALARGIVLRPSILLLDEPLSNLDPELRKSMRALLIEIQQQTDITMLFVTHDQMEALSISDQIWLLLGNTVRQSGSPQNLFHKPVDPEVARFFGNNNLFSGKIENHTFHHPLFSCRVKEHQNGKKSITIRPEDIQISTLPEKDLIEAEVTSLSFEGETTRIFLMFKNRETCTALAIHPQLSLGQKVWLRFPENKTHCFR